ncbi:MAG: DUF4386 family protein [Sphingobacteriaceae bacterium]|nr:DUF4386 family protein [Sphingobacteriaceae bacterium]
MERLKSDNRNAIITGAFFITATVAAIIGLNLYGPILNNTDSLSAAVANYNQIALGAFFELTLVVAMIGTGIMLFPALNFSSPRHLSRCNCNRAHFSQ